MQVNVDWRYLRPALIVVSLSVVFSGLLIFLGNDYHTNMGSLHDLKNDEYSEVEMKLNEVRQDKELIALYLDKFNALEKTGVFDKKQRVEWVDAVNNARRKMKLPLVRYQIAPQLPYSANYLHQDGYADVMVSQVKLEAGLLHEGDLVDLFNWMDHYAPGQLHLSHCKMKRAEEVFGYYGDRPNLNLLCDLRWFTVHPLENNNEEGRDDVG